MSENDEQYMEIALEEAQKAFAKEEVPIGAIIVKDSEIIAKAHNLKESNQDPTAHAEILAIDQAVEKLGGWRLLDCTMYVTIEPCVMCAGALVESRVERLVFGAPEPKSGAAGSVFNLTNNDRLNHRLEVESGVLAADCKQLMKDFFVKLRES
ncbi:tRNA adenosine(34) deaminase TadA [Halanaerobacter jeridensis]|uniref:tRNA-specific adenosine deaminase n=1 Tax=Halanaerobacter jeridensis TaxID=706427 RepID=A0A939BPT3_9FIRM|nr:tRNA(adenine34) deaminase [Halanaerobacter jeridensis]